MTSNSIDKWYEWVVERGAIGEELDIVNALKAEAPALLCAIMERSCNLQCRHCLFQPEKSSETESNKRNLAAIIENLVYQLPGATENPAFLHEGRIIRPWHVYLLKKLGKIRPDVRLGLIDNGAYTNNLQAFSESGVKLNWLDISCDGTRESHNLQRDPINQRAYEKMMEGFSYAREVVKPGGRVSGLMTLTSLNYRDVLDICATLLSENTQFADMVVVTTMNPQLPENYTIEINGAQLKSAFEQIKEARAQLGDRVFLRFYGLRHLKLLSQELGGRFLGSFTGTSERYRNTVLFEIDEVPVRYHPTSIWPQEAFLVDADGAQRMAYSQKFTLRDLQNESELRPYTVQYLSPTSDYAQAYNQEVGQWWTNFGRQHMQKEIEFFNDLKLGKAN